MTQTSAQTPAQNKGGRPRVTKPCERCGVELSAREARQHRCQSAAAAPTERPQKPTKPIVVAQQDCVQVQEPTVDDWGTAYERICAGRQRSKPQS
jgi:hypothetical protein